MGLGCRSGISALLQRRRSCGVRNAFNELSMILNFRVIILRRTFPRKEEANTIRMFWRDYRVSSWHRKAIGRHLRLGLENMANRISAIVRGHACSIVDLGSSIDLSVKSPLHWDLVEAEWLIRIEEVLQNMLMYCICEIKNFKVSELLPL